MHGNKQKLVNALLTIITVLAIFVLAFSFVLLLKWILPAPVLTTQFFASVDELSTLATQNGSLDKFKDEFAKEIDHLERASNELVQTTPTGQLKTISDDIFSVSQWLKTNRPILANAAKHQQKYKAIVDSLTKDASNLELILQKMPTVNGDWIASLLLGILWVGVFIGVLNKIARK